jgi:hypothetical protein
MHLFAVLLAAVAVTTGPAQNVTSTTATVTGTVAPSGTYHFEYGPTTAYGARTNDAAADGSGDARADLSGLAPNTTYHYRVVSGTAQGNDATFRTAPTPRRPVVGSCGARDVTTTTATLPAAVNPERQPTTVHFEYGLTRSYGLTTPETAVGAGATSVIVGAPVAGLTPYTRYHFRVVARNATGVIHGRDRTFRTDRLPTAVSIVVLPRHPVWGSVVNVSGTVAGAGAGGIPVALERSAFPFSAGFVQVGPTIRANRSGHYVFGIRDVTASARLRVVTRSDVVATSDTATAVIAVKVGLRVLRGRRGRVILTGVTFPAVPQGRASLQRLTRRGHWVRVGRRHRLSQLSDDRSRYRFTVRRRHSARTYRVVVDPRDRGAHVRGISRTHTLTGRR